MHSSLQLGVWWHITADAEERLGVDALQCGSVGWRLLDV